MPRGLKDLNDFRRIFYNSTAQMRGETIPRGDSHAMKSYSVWCQHRILPLLDTVKRDARILELGANSGYLLEFLKNHGFANVEGIDISEKAVSRANLEGANVKLADAFEYLDSQQNTFDVILAIEFIEHFTRDEATLLLQKIYASLKLGGRLIIHTPNGQGLLARAIIYSDLTHLTVFTPRSLEQVLTLVGFGNIRFRETGPIAKDLTGLTRTLLWRLIRLIANSVRLIEVGVKQEVWTENMICCCQKQGSTS